ncbi:hypothetical protein K493DRAFT_317423 [Basidiobolus meristosporus CBS 931.73]|uniref:GDP/GTP exchange factor Sec2 N-terminal domain-containing protein n=1 Tax=Basidiobolus meristosporus CBS 931.73 TaxID=1314790 RepID=A0A1Y1Y007_9FUNG|nr:hypothetical protein K493DRAFT_317423 [Basidiobolus meristosporus CBS 931.73]|eukprot:ORX91235.1 hypothetical protein K493DRAFT_317423 [Basidiobolus meristosporus CBS 931.73]
MSTLKCWNCGTPFHETPSQLPSPTSNSIPSTPYLVHSELHEEKEPTGELVTKLETTSKQVLRLEKLLTQQNEEVQKRQLQLQTEQHQAQEEFTSLKIKYQESLVANDQLRIDLLSLQEEHEKILSKLNMQKRNSQLERDMLRLNEKLLAEAEMRGEIELEKCQIEHELEDLSTKLFEEANKMVVEQKQLYAKIENRNETLEKQNAELVDLMTFQKEQLDELKLRVEELEKEKTQWASERAKLEKEKERDDAKCTNEPVNRASVLSRQESLYDSCYSSDAEGTASTGHVLTFHLCDYRFAEFKEYFESPKTPKNLLTSKFVKRCIAEDIDASMKFESMNVRGWFQQRKLTASIQGGTLIIETATRKPQSGCTLCLQIIQTPLFYRFFYEDNDSEAKEICPFCRDRLYTICEFYSYLRLLHAGIVKGSLQRIYLDCLRLKFRLFLARVGSNVTTDTLDEVRESDISSTS